jgi:hypothetical protein
MYPDMLEEYIRDEKTLKGRHHYRDNKQLHVSKELDTL